MIDKNWIVTSATCCKRDDIVTITFNDYSIFYADQNQHQITSTLFHVHQDLDACLIRTTDMSDIVAQIPCLNKVSITFCLRIPGNKILDLNKMILLYSLGSKDKTIFLSILGSNNTDYITQILYVL